MENKEYTKGVKNLLGNPKKAILKLSIPIIIGMIFQTLYNIADGFWVAGLGSDELAAIGLFFPFFIIIISIGVGIGVGGGSAISRRIGARDKDAADNTATHTIILGLVVAIIFSSAMIPFLDEIFHALSENVHVGQMATQYAIIIFCSTVLMIFTSTANAILRSEGDAKRSMYGLLVGAILNIILDPIFIYVLDLGVSGAAIATVVSVFIASLYFIYCLFLKRDTYLKITFRDFKYNKNILAEIFAVGVPSTLSQLSMSIAMIFLNVIIEKVRGDDGIAIFTSGWRIVLLGIIPLMGLAQGVTSVTAAAFGAKDKEKLRTAFLYAIKIGVLVELAIGSVIALFAQPVSYIFTYSKDSAHISKELIEFLRITVVLYPTIPLGMLTSAMFRGIKEGNKSLIVTIFRTIILQVPVAYLLGITLHYGLDGVWLGMIIGNFIAVIITFSWGKSTIENVI